MTMLRRIAWCVPLALCLVVSVATAQSESNWPRQIVLSDVQVLLFEPQLESYDDRSIGLRAPVSVSSDQGDPFFGAVWLTSPVSVDPATRTLICVDARISRWHFTGLSAERTQAVVAAVGQSLAVRPIRLAIDGVLEARETLRQQQAHAEQLSTEPPTIVLREQPALLVVYDGPPRLVQVTADNGAAASGLMRVANTPFFVVLDLAGQTYYLKGAGLWFTATDPLGPFRPAAGAPVAVAELAVSSNYQDPQYPLTIEQASRLEIVTATDPTELIWTDGPMELGVIADTNLLYVTNTLSDMFVSIQTQRLYALLAGRWYTAPTRSGPWAYVAPDDLPQDFARIMPNSDKADVLAHVAGTAAAREAVDQSQVPRTIAIERASYVQPRVVYDGPPRFEPIHGLAASYAINTAQAVVLISSRYYLCDAGVWYVSNTPWGYWDLCTVVPVEIYRIPPTYPIYPVRYVRVYGWTPQVVYCGYTSGYVGTYIHRGVVVYGTGRHYHPWIGRQVYTRPATFGFSARYSVSSGDWGFSFAVAFGGGRAWVGHRYDPWRSPCVAFGYGGYRPVVIHRPVNVTIVYKDGTRAPDRYHDRDYDKRHDRNDGFPQWRQEAMDRREQLAKSVYDRRRELEERRYDRNDERGYGNRTVEDRERDQQPAAVTRGEDAKSPRERTEGGGASGPRPQRDWRSLPTPVIRPAQPQPPSVVTAPPSSVEPPRVERKPEPRPIPSVERPRGKQEDLDHRSRNVDSDRQASIPRSVQVERPRPDRSPSPFVIQDDRAAAPPTPRIERAVPPPTPRFDRPAPPVAPRIESSSPTSPPRMERRTPTTPPTRVAPVPVPPPVVAAPQEPLVPGFPSYESPRRSRWENEESGSRRGRSRD